MSVVSFRNVTISTQLAKKKVEEMWRKIHEHKWKSKVRQNTNANTHKKLLASNAGIACALQIFICPVHILKKSSALHDK